MALTDSPINVLAPAFALCLLASCGGENFDGTWKVPLLYKIDIQQGNSVEQAMLDKIKPGMTKEQVRFIMGTPMLVDSLRKDRWDYIYTIQKEGSVRKQRHIYVLFDDEDILIGLDGDVQAGYGNRRQEEGEAVEEEEA
ncbi:MAG: outer membrane protein assembly factor BamE, partial [Candidatus Eutrophobiaceae bacterium]